MRVTFSWLLVASVLGCGAKTGLYVPPPPPCENELEVPSPSRCDRVVLGTPIALTAEPTEEVTRGVDQLDVAPIVDGVRVVLQRREWPRDSGGRSEMITLALDGTGRARGESETLLDFPLRTAVSLTEPTAIGWGCGDAVLADLATSSAMGERDHGCALRIDERGATREIALDVDPCADLSWDDGSFSLLTVGAGFALVRVSIEGAAVVERIPLDLPDLPGSSVRGADLGWRRIPNGPDAWLWPVFRSEGGADLLPLDASGRFGEPIAFGAGRVRDVTWAIDGDHRRWLVWSEPDGVRLARLDDAGRVVAPVSVGVPEGTGIAVIRARPLWIADRLLLAVYDRDADEASILVVAPSGEVREQLVLGPGHTVDLVAVPGGALVLHAEARTIEREGRTIHIGEVLTSRTLGCE